MICDAYPAIKKAVVMILYDNGMVNRVEPEEESLATWDKSIEGRFTQDQLEACEAELAALTAEELEDVCCGEQYKTPSETLDSLLNSVIGE